MLFLLLACATPDPPATAPAVASPFRVAVLGDRSGEPDDRVWQRMVDQAARLRPDLILTVGDMADDAEDPDDWTRALAPLDALDIEVQYVPGNHDIHDLATADTFRSRTGQEPYRSFDRGGIHWVVVDNSIATSWDAVPADQQAWLADDLARSTLPAVVLMHRPFWALAVAAGEADPMHDLYVAHGVRAVLTGHWHRHSHQRIDGIDYVIVGSSGGATPGVPHVDRGNVPELLWVTVEGDALHLATVADGRVLPVDHVSLQDAHRLRALERGAVRGTLDPDAAAVELAIHNVHDAPLATSATISGGSWRSDRVPVALAPDATLETTVAVRRDGPLVPWPHLHVDLPLPDAGVRRFAVPVDLVRTADARRHTPTVDGDLSEWTTPPTIDSWTTAHGAAPTAEPTAAWLAWDDDALYLAARCADSAPERIKNVHDGRDGQLVYDDRIGLTLGPRPDQLYWLYVTSDGDVWDLHADRASGQVDRSWDAVRAAGRAGPDGWSIEAAVAWSDLGLDGPPATIRADLRRKQERTQGEAVWTPAFGHADADRMGTVRLVR